MSATTKQVSLITRLLAEKIVPDDFRARIAEVLADSTTTTKDASLIIDWLFKQPRAGAAEPAPQATPGFYVTGPRTDQTAVKVQANKAGTGTYALAWTGHSWEYRPGLARTLAHLTPMTAEDAAFYGLASGRCINCCRPLGGASLSAKVSALVGYGETCANHNGWAYPTGAKAQREYVAAREAQATESAVSMAYQNRWGRAENE